MTKRRKRGCLIVSGILFVALGYLGLRFGKDAYNLYQGGWLDVGGEKTVVYRGTSMENLKALHTAMMLYHDSEERFPDASGWMDALKPYIGTRELPEAEAMKKFIDPTIQAGNGAFGYAMNDAVAGKYKGDIADPDTTPLLFSSKETGWNAHGDPQALAPDPHRKGGDLVLTVSGTILIDGKPAPPKP
ncbi:MAG TPA: hypothetical protein PLH94_03575 [Fimbriimonadaceae bacterium]|nr:hypothetical protein [Fimbriimonadaceae bacterium]